MTDDLRETLNARLAEVTGRTQEQLSALLPALVPESFADADGELDDTLVRRFASTLGPVREPLDPVRTALNSHAPMRRAGVAENYGGSSIRDHRDAINEAYTNIRTRTVPTEANVRLEYDRIKSRGTIR